MVTTEQMRSPHPLPPRPKRTVSSLNEPALAESDLLEAAREWSVTGEVTVSMYLSPRGKIFFSFSKTVKPLIREYSKVDLAAPATERFGARLAVD